jgi:hypothetical protein
MKPEQKATEKTQKPIKKMGASLVESLVFLMNPKKEWFGPIAGLSMFV